MGFELFGVKKLTIEFEGQVYRDDRIYVINLNRGIVSRNNDRKTRYLVNTYRNTPNLPTTRTDDFSTKKEVVDYLKKVKPETPLVSKNGKSLQIPEGVDPWEHWLDWLNGMGLQSAITEYQHVPKWAEERGIMPQNDYVVVDELIDINENHD